MFTEKDVRREMDRLDVLSGIDTTAIPIRVSGRMTSAWGKCVMKQAGGGYTVQELVFAQRLLQRGSWDHVAEVIRHEYAHAYVLIKFQHRGSHSALWREYARKFGCNGSRCNAFPEVDEGLYRYFVTCGQCGATARYKRRGKVVMALERDPNCKAYRCTKCGGHHFLLRESTASADER